MGTDRHCRVVGGTTSRSHRDPDRLASESRAGGPSDSDLNESASELDSDGPAGGSTASGGTQAWGSDSEQDSGRDDPQAAGAIS